MNGLQINIFRPSGSAGFHIDAHFMGTADPFVVQLVDETLRASGLRVDKFNVIAASWVAKHGKLTFNGHNPQFYSTHTVDFRTASCIDLIKSKLEAILTMLRERVEVEEAGAVEGPTMPQVSDRTFLELQRQRAQDAGSAYADQTLGLKDADVFQQRARALGGYDDLPMEFGLLAFRLGAALRQVRNASPELYEHYGEALRANPFLRNVFYKEPLDATHLSHPESVTPTGSLSPHAHDNERSVNLGGQGNDIYNVLPTSEQLQFVKRDGE